MIDPGHGGIDSGAVWYGTQEKTLTLPVSKLLREELLAMGVRNVVLTRDEDVLMGLAERAEFANKHDNPIFVSIHFNANLNRTVTGIELYVMPKSEKARELAETLAVPLQGLGRRFIGVKPANMKVLRVTDHPAVIVEGGFLSNSTENRLIKTGDYQKKLVKAIAEGIVAYRDLSGAKPGPAPVPAPAQTQLGAATRPAPKLTPIPVAGQPADPPRAPTPSPTTAGFRVQFGAFSQPRNATNLRAELQGKGIEAVVLQRVGETKTFHRVVSQRTFSDAGAAGRWADDLVQNQGVEQTAVTR